MAEIVHEFILPPDEALSVTAPLPSAVPHSCIYTS